MSTSSGHTPQSMTHHTLRPTTPLHSVQSSSQTSVWQVEATTQAPSMRCRAPLTPSSYAHLYTRLVQPQLDGTSVPVRKQAPPHPLPDRTLHKQLQLHPPSAAGTTATRCSATNNTANMQYHSSCVLQFSVLNCCCTLQHPSTARNIHCQPVLHDRLVQQNLCIAAIPAPLAVSKHHHHPHELCRCCKNRTILLLAQLVLYVVNVWLQPPQPPRCLFTLSVAPALSCTASGHQTTAAATAMWAVQTHYCQAL